MGELALWCGMFAPKGRLEWCPGLARGAPFSCWDGRISIPLPSSCPGKVDESSLYIRPYELNANSISDIKTFKPLYQLSFHRRLE